MSAVLMGLPFILGLFLILAVIMSLVFFVIVEIIERNSKRRNRNEKNC